MSDPQRVFALAVAGLTGQTAKLKVESNAALELELERDSVDSELMRRRKAKLVKR